MTNEPAVPNEPFTQPPRRGGLPGWAWALIGGGALMLIAMIVVAVIVLNAVLGAIANEQAAPAAEAPTALSTDEAGSSATTGLDEHADFGAPTWSFPAMDGWDVAVAEEDGVNQATNAELGCLFTTSLNRHTPSDLDATGDRSDTETYLQILAQAMADSVSESAVLGDIGSVEIAVGNGSETLEFATRRVTHTYQDGGGSFINDIAGRALPQSDAWLYLVVSCPEALVEAGDSPFEELLGTVAVDFE